MCCLSCFYSATLHYEKANEYHIPLRHPIRCAGDQADQDCVIDWASVRAVIETVYTTGSAPTGRPSYDGLMLFKIELLRVGYGLRDAGVEEMVNDRISSTPASWG